MPTKRTSTHKGRRRPPRKTRGESSPVPTTDPWEQAWLELRRRGLVLSDRPVRPPPENPNFTPIRVEGEPLSEMIIRERR